MKERIMKYLISKYDPEAIITYGSYADGSANAHSDFDALLIAEDAPTHDESMIEGVVLDVFIYPAETFAQDFDADAFIQIHDGRIELDKNGTAEKLKQAVLQEIDSIPFKTEAEIRQEIAWCEKMLLRTSRGDAEGYYRWHWLLMDSLEIYCDIVQKRYFGPKKALKQMAAEDLEAYRIYEAALACFSRETLTAWIEYLSDLSNKAAGDMV